MASQTASTTSSQRSVGYDDFVDDRIERTRSAVKSADLATGLVTLLAWWLGLLLLAAAADHWLVVGGFDRWGRFALFAIGLVGGLLYIGTRLGPMLVGSVNPLYAAKQIEEDSPQLKNSLLNLLQLRGKTSGSPAAVQRTLERQAAERLAAAGETAVDRSGLVRIARVVLALTAMIGIYVIASPKDFFASAGRVLAPWADIDAPSRVRFDMLEPGDIEVAQGERLEVSAFVTGLEQDELVELVYSTLDGSLVDRRVSMTPRREGSLQYDATLPPGSGAAAALGLQGDLVYRLEAGDSLTREYRVSVLTAPTIAPISVRYDYPKYTGYSSREVEGVGDLRAIEGTRVTITARANLPIDSAQIDLGADGRTDVRMRVDRDQATGPFTLRRDPSAEGDWSTSYVLRFTSKDNQANNSPPQYRVEVLRDLPPEAAIVFPEESTTEVAADQQVTIEVEARDPDFALSQVRLAGKARGKEVVLAKLLQSDFRGKFVGDHAITPSELGLRPGDVLEYWVEVQDNKSPNPNTAKSEPKQIRVVGPREPADGQSRDAQKQPGDPSQGEESGEDGDSTEDGGQSGEGGQTGESGGQPNNSGSGSEQQPGQSGQQPQGDQSEEEQGKGRKPSPGGLRAPGEGGGSGDEQEEQTNSGGGGQSGDESGSEQQSQQSGGESSAGGEAGESDNESGQPGESGDSTDRQDRSGDTGQSSGDGSSGESGNGADESPVARNGEDDGTAFERIRDFLNNQQESGGGRESKQRRPDGDRKPNDTGDGEPQSREGDPSERPDGAGERGESEGSTQQQNGGRRTPEEGTGDSESQPRQDGDPGEQPERGKNSPGPGERDRSGRQSDSTTSEPGAEAPPGDSTDPQAGPREGTGSSGQNQAADQGAGQSGDQGAGDSTGRAGSQQQSESATGQSGGEQTESGSETTGGGEQAGGQDAGPTAGDDQQNGTGESGSEENGTTADSPGEQAPGGEPGAPSDSTSGQEGQDGDNGSGDPSSQNSNDAGERPPTDDSPNGGEAGRPGDTTSQPSGQPERTGGVTGSNQGTETGGDDANLDYAREQTDLVLERLEKQLKQREVDRELLDKLGWTEQDLRRFVQRWQARKQEAATRGPGGEAELDRALRNLGLKPGSEKATRRISDDKLRDLRERARQAIPPRLRQATDAYNRSLNALGSEASASDGE